MQCQYPDYGKRHRVFLIAEVAITPLQLPAQIQLAKCQTYNQPVSSSGLSMD